MTRWLLLLQDFDITFIDKPGKDNIVADLLSQLTNGGEDTPIENHFLNEHLFSISTNSPWYANIANYLVACKLTNHLSPKEKKRII